MTDLFLIAVLLPIRLAAFTVAVRRIFPICLRFILDGFGNFRIQSGTGEPDWRRTFAMLQVQFDKFTKNEVRCLRFQIGSIFIGKICNCFP